MTFFLPLISFLTFSANYDEQGVMFEEEAKRTLVLVPESLEVYCVPSSVEVIIGGSIDESAFYPCRKRIKEIKFGEGSKVREVPKYCFAESNLQEIDFSECYELKTIQESTFRLCEQLLNVQFPPRLEYLLYGCFYSCSSLVSVSFPSSLLKIDGYSAIHSAPFASCKKLSSVTFEDPPSIQSIGGDSFYSTNITEFRVPASCTEFSGSVLSCKNIHKVTVDEDNPLYMSSDNGRIVLKKPGDTILFCASLNLDSYTVPAGITCISVNSFRASSFEYIELSSSVNRLEIACFRGSNIRNMTISTTVNFISSSVFLDCKYLEWIEFKPSINILNAELFLGCISLKEMIVPEGVTTISEDVFNGCKRIEHIFIPSSVTTLKSGCFSGINSTAYIEFGNESMIKYEDGIVYSCDYTKIIASIEASRTEITLKDEVKIIGSDSFKGSKIENLIITDNSLLEIIEEGSFAGSSIKSFRSSKYLRKICKSGFEDCEFLSEVDFSSNEDNLVEIESYGFRNSNIEEVKYPRSIEIIGEKAFYGIKSLTKVVFLGEKIRWIGDECYSYTGIRTFTVKPDVNFGKSCFLGSKLSRLIFSEEMRFENISDYSIMGCENLKEVILGENLKLIGRSAFEGCEGIEELILSETIEVISLNAFKKCINLKKVEIPTKSKLRQIQEQAFSECTSLREFNVSGANENFYSTEGVLYDKNITKIIVYLPASPREIFEVPRTIITIEAFAFQDAVNLIQVKLPELISNAKQLSRKVTDQSNSQEGDEAIKIIGFRSFKGCKKLREINLPTSLKRIDHEAFADCSSLECGSIKYSYSEEMFQMLVDSKAPLISLKPCSSKQFTIESKDETFFAVSSVVSVLSVLTASDDHEDKDEIEENKFKFKYIYTYTHESKNVAMSGNI